MYLYGAGGHARVVIDILEACHIEIDGIVDDNPLVDSLLSYPVLHSADGLSPMIVCVGSNSTRMRIAQSLDTAFGTAVHPSAVVSPRAVIGEGTVVMQGSVVQACAVIGRHCIINTASSVDHECVLGDYVHISPHATLCGNVHVGEGSWIGAGATVLPGVRIGSRTVVGAGTVVTSHLPDGVVAVGVGCRIVGPSDKHWR